MTDLKQLNPEQRKAAETTEGPVLILAGAGSGKTRALTYRIAHLLDLGVPPYEILALTFTNKAAAEMRERVQQLAGEGARRVTASTFHSFCARLLRADIAEIGFTRDFVIYDDADQLALFAEIQKELDLGEEEWPKRMLRAKVSDAKNRAVRPEEYIGRDGGFRGEKLMAVYRLYEKKMREYNALDFDDLLLKTIQLFEQCPAVLEKYQDRYRYIHVDEYQDTNAAQYRIVYLLSRKWGNLCVVGDDDQSIYGWRGADIRNILDFERDFPGCVTLRLEQNYRSTANILEAANAVIAHNTERKPKKLWTDSGRGEKITRYAAWSERDEADFVCRTISAGAAKGAPLGDFAVLYRTNAQSRVLEEAFTAYGLPYAVLGSLRFYDRAEIKDVLAYLRLVVNPQDEVSLRRVINTPKRGLGDAAVAEVLSAAAQADMTPFEVCTHASELPLSARIQKKVQAFGDVMEQLAALSELLPLSDLIAKLLELTGYWEYLEKEKRADGRNEDRMANVKELITAAGEFEKNGEEATLSAFLENISLVANVNDETGDSAVTLLTMHSAKGLEFPVVFVVGMEENIFPSARAAMTPEGVEEERRLCYVAITRARKKLYLCSAQSRFLYNNVQRNRESRFLEEIPPQLLELPEPPRGGGRTATGQSRGAAGAGARYGRAAQDLARTAAGTPLGGTVAAKPRGPKQNYEFAPYMRVVHDRFGPGTVLEVAGGVLTVEFNSGGVKKIVADLAPIRPAE